MSPFRTEQLKVDVSYVYQDTTLGLEIRTEGELEQLVASLQNDQNTVVVLHNQKRNITVYIYLRFRE